MAIRQTAVEGALALLLGALVAAVPEEEHASTIGDLCRPEGPGDA